MLSTIKYKYYTGATGAHEKGIHRVMFLLVFLLTMAGMMPTAQAQSETKTFYTLTNGNLWWIDGDNPPADQDAANRYVRGWDQSSRWAEIRTLGHHVGENTNLIVSQGEVYLKLDTIYNSTTGKMEGRVVPWRVAEVNSFGTHGLYNNLTQGFDPLCLWERSSTTGGQTGFYYQEWYCERDGNTYVYRLNHHTDAEGNNLIGVDATAVGEHVNIETEWFDWDFGAAVTVTENSSSRYYWIMFDTIGHPDNIMLGTWDTLSNHSYQRPDELMYNPYNNNDYNPPYSTLDDDRSYFPTPTVTFYDNRIVTVDHTRYNIPHGMPATVMPVTATYNDREIGKIVDGKGLQDVMGKKKGEPGAPYEIHDLDITYEDTLVINPNITYNRDHTIIMKVVPEYNMYVEESYRRGIALGYEYRENEIYGSNGVATRDTLYYWPESYGGAYEKHRQMPDTLNDETTIDSVRFSVDPRSSRYLTLDNRRNTEANDYELSLIVSEPPVSRHAVHLTATVYYSNGTTQVHKDTLYISYTPERTVVKARRGPAIGGMVFGGGRVANVGWDYGNNEVGSETNDIVGGNTHITVHSADTIYALYGGNDIAGWVQGEKGATIQLGTELTSEEHPVHIGYIYGGGCGYYSYGGLFNLAERLAGGEESACWRDNNVLSGRGISGGDYAFQGKVYPWGTSGALGATPVVDHTFGFDPTDNLANFAHAEKGQGTHTDAIYSGTIPYIRTSHITVGVSDTVDDYHYLHNDYILIDSLFGGAENAYIGVTASEAEPANGVTIDINGGTLMTVFGGNNYGGQVATTSTVFVDVFNTKLTDEENIENTLLSGYGRDFGIRHLFGGGNLVDGSHANVRILGGMCDTVFLGGNNATVTQAYGTVECLRNGEIDRFGHNGHFIWTNPTTDTTDNCRHTDIDEWEGDLGRYNIRCLFGGNNAAAMNSVSMVQLHSGGVCSIYGGGNAGDMNNDGLLGSSLPPIYRSLLLKHLGPNEAPYNSGWDGPMPSVIGSIVTALSSSNIICEYVYGGCRQANVKYSCGVYVAGGAFGYINGGNDVSGDVGSTVARNYGGVDIPDGHGGTIRKGTAEGTYVVCDSNVVIFGDVYGGSDGYLHCNDPKKPGYYNEEDLYDTYTNVAYDPYHEHVGKLIPTHNNTNVHIKGGLIMGNVYSAGINASVGFASNGHIKYQGETWENPSILRPADGVKMGEVHTTISGGEIQGQVFGGGFMASIYGIAYMNINGNAHINTVFAGNDVAGQVTSFGSYHSSTIDYSGAVTHADSVEKFNANCANYVNSLNEQLNEYNSVENKWEANYSVYVRVEDSVRIHTLYGSGNGEWDYTGETESIDDDISICAADLGNLPHQKSAFLDIHTSGGYIDTIYGGGDGAGVQDKVIVLLNNTKIDNVDATNHRGEWSADEESMYHWPIGNDALAEARKKIFVGTIFGGNNHDEMATCVPEIRLTNGSAKNVYGGANAGRMGWHETFKDANNKDVKGVTTYVKVNSENVYITDTVFGGCRMGDVAGMSYVDVTKTHDNGINYLYGGNDISGLIGGNTRVDVSGGTVHHIWGGSNGRYDFIPIGNHLNKIYPYGSTTTGNPADSAGRMITIAGKPDVDSSNVNIWGGDINTTVYGGGSMADCRATCVVIDDRLGGADTAVIAGSVYAGGEGDWENLNNEHRGNVTEATHLHLYHASQISDAKAYGGGKGGDVAETFIKTYQAWDKPFLELYGGCWGSDVSGTAHLDFEGINLVYHLYGGNDFTGNVNRSVINVYSGKFKNIYGAGNGTYPASAYNTGVYAGNKFITRPNNEYVELNIHDGLVDSCVYGGGRMGTVFRYERNSNGTYHLVPREGETEPSVKVPDTTLTWLTAHKDPAEYSYIILNMHGGQILKNVFAGGCGDYQDATQTPIVYGLKNVNMDGGYIFESLYGGSEFVHDGYKAECTDHQAGAKVFDQTTKRPSSIVNITGGTVNGFLYGGGYLGDVYGSTYVNVGTTALDTCRAYRNTIADSVAAYSRFKPGVDNGLVDAMGHSEDLYINHSIYAGANWGTNTGNTSFTKEGYHGGESRVVIDGKDYQTTIVSGGSDPAMNIRKSIIGAGTSALAGDIVSTIEVRNYGETDNCAVSKQLESIQRADSVTIHNTAIEYTGSTNAASAFVSEPYSMLNLGVLNFRGYNVAQMDAIVDYIGELNVYEDALVLGQLKLVENTTLVHDALTTGCEDDCAKMNLVDPYASGKQHTLLLLNNGVDVTLQDNSSYGEVHGYSYVAANNGFSSTIVGKNVQNDLTDDGFVATCRDSNKVADNRGAENITWSASTEDNTEHVFTNYISENYRVWRAGDGLRRRETTILAHTVPDSLPNSDVSVLFKEGALKLAIAEAEITLPATDGGNYYLLDGTSGFSISGENAPLNLVDSAWLTSYSDGVNGNNSIRSHHANHTDVYEDETEHGGPHGKWDQAALSSESLKTGVSEIQRSPENTFGLVMVPVTTTGEFPSSTPIYPDEGTPSASLVVSGNSYVNAAGIYRSPQVAEGSQIRPKMRFYLTYDTNFTSAFLGTVSFVMKEMKPAGADGTAGDIEVGKVEVKVYISTIVEDFKDMEEDVIAIYNNGRTNTFTRKVMLPAVMEERDLYLTAVKWVPTNATTGNGEEINPSTVSYTTDHFYMVPDEAAVTSTDPNYPRTTEPWTSHTDHSSHNRFAMSIVPGENISTDLNAVIGWNSLRVDTINVYRLIDSTGTGVIEGAGTWSTNTMISQSLPGFTPAGATQPYGANGLMIGTLNGRGSTVLNVSLNFDGNRTYDGINGKGYVGKVVLTFKSIHNDEERGTFNLTVNVKTREHGDTIYIASNPDYVERGGVKVFPYKYSYRYTHAEVGELLRDKVILGKSPGCYVNNFQQALATGVYQEGDVLCIIDTVKIGNGQNVFIQGATGPAIEVIRYEGHHHDLPGDSCVYRGPMVQVAGSSATFSARNIAFHGGAGGHIKPCKRVADVPQYSSVVTNDTEVTGAPTTTQYYVPLAVGIAKPDTNIAYAPILQIMDSGTVTLSDGTSVRHNWNGYGVRASERTAGISSRPRDMGAVSLTNGGTLKLQNNVTFSDNFVHTMPVDSTADPLYDAHKPGNGTIYIDGGILELEESSPLSSILIAENHLMNPGIHSSDPATREAIRWWTYYPDPDNPATATRWEVNPAKYADWPKANVYLTRTQTSTGNVVKDTMGDVKSDLILVSGTQSNTSSIGVRKWFPGVTMRDTMAFATFEGGDNSILSDAVYNGVFTSDDNERIFYNTKVNSMYAYLFRCATFKHQWYASGTHTTIDPLAVIDANGDDTPDFTAEEIKSSSPLHFGYIENSCPLGGDSIIYRLQGGFAPYSYTWTDPDFTDPFRTAETPYANAVVQNELLDVTLTNEQRLEKYLASIADTLYLPYIKLSTDQAQFSHTIRVTATDATGECTLYKDINLTINRSFDNTPSPMTYFASTSTAEQRADTNNWSLTPTDGWTDTARAKIAYGSRNYKAIHVVPYVWVDRNSGTISAMVAGDDNDHVYEYVSESERHELSNLYFCEGDIVVLKAREPYTSVTPNTHFLMWDFDPYYKNPAAYVVPPHESDVIAYFGPNSYWHEHIHTTAEAHAEYDNHYYYERPAGANYATSYHGDVHIYNEDGLAWFISVVNGLNGVQARQFYFNKVYLHDKAEGYNMKDYLWTPVGTEHQPFRGWFIGVGSGDTDTEPLHHYENHSTHAIVVDPSGMEPGTVDTIYDKVIVKNIIVNEPEMEYTGFFGNLDTARISGIELQGVFARGAQYVGALAAASRDAKIDNVAVTTNEEGALINTTTILTTHYVSGGLIGQSNNDKITNSTSYAKYIGDAVYSGGMIGYGNADTLHNSVARNDNRMNGIYVGGLVGYSTGDDNQKAFSGLKRLFGSKSKAAGKPSHIANNYVMLVSNGHSNRVGGLVGYAQNTVLENNYVYGEVIGENNAGGVAATMANNAKADRNYYAEDASKQAVGNTTGSTSLTNTATFKGKGNQVSISNPVGGVNNLTRVLNAWVRQQNAQGGNYKTWRSDLETVNNGYPIYGTPDMIPVRDSMTVYGCDSVEWEGIAYNDGDTISRRVIDNVEMIDSTMHIRFVLHYGSVVNLSDSAILGEAYEGYGFTMSQEESELLRNNLDSLGQVTIVLTDTVQSVYGCDSIVSLTLIFHDTIVNQPEPASTSPSDIRAYPNPTLNYVTIEAASLQHVELYDNEGRKLEDYDANGNETITINVANRSTGIYYLRIHAGDNVTIQKLIKQ